MAQIIDGKFIAKQIKDQLKEEVSLLKEAGTSVCLAVIQVGQDPASSVYVNNKKKACAYIGIDSVSYELKEDTEEEELIQLIEKLNGTENVHGILVQLPLPAHINEDRIIRTISPDKDVDGFHPVSVGRLWLGEKGFVSCTPAGIIQLLKRSGLEIEGKECVVVGRGIALAGKCNGDRGTFQNCGLKRSNTQSGYPDRSSGTAEDDHGRICQRRSGCDRCGNAPECGQSSLRRCGF